MYADRSRGVVPRHACSYARRESATAAATVAASDAATVASGKPVAGSSTMNVSPDPDGPAEEPPMKADHTRPDAGATSVAAATPLSVMS